MVGWLRARRRRGERAGGTPARMRTHGRHAPSSLPCSLTPSLFPSLSKISISLISPKAGATKFRRLPISEQKVGQSCFLFFRLSHAALPPPPMHCKQAKLVGRRRKIVPDPRGDFYAIARQSGLKLTAVSLSASVSDFVANFISSVFFSRIRLALFPRACPSSKPD